MPLAWNAATFIELGNGRLAKALRIEGLEIMDWVDFIVAGIDVVCVENTRFAPDDRQTCLRTCGRTIDAIMG